MNKISNFTSMSEMVMENSLALHVYYDNNTVCRFVNKAVYEWFGKTPEEVIDKMTSKDLLGSLYEMNKPYVLSVLQGNNEQFERDIILPNGETRCALVNYYPNHNNGIIEGFFVDLVDITPLKSLENELLISNNMIGKQNKRLLNFANIVSHNLKSYSNNLASIVELLQEAESEEEREEMTGYLKNISDGFKTTINHLNEISKLENQITINNEVISINEYIEKSIQILKIQIVKSNAKVINLVNPELKLLINPVYMESILLNLITNAIKYKHPDRDPVIEINCIQENDKIVLSIKDNGSGIDLQRHGEDLFKIYKTFHGNKDAQGIGLFITKYQIESLGGEISVESEVNIGTTFKVYLSSKLV
ncbi:PAS domain-containing sensor histidine kinase [Flavobacterium sp. SUN046]|uniref:PAS domain-containing sensor histidine kinase n=1 Tax=Flavobacterium sp. SUN046 TaxID=3002440 RepID=UPI002DB5C352|nr:PAS domain-containing sensor histidine kinase [Flavobacterium sp. SUN046]MEC4048625.1 PAS domain-containing sensor histidine kinase [Flavobacterium sp. SUN046]